MHAYILHNDTVIPAESSTLSAGQVGLLSGWGVFSTVRVKGGVLFAWEHHWRRMQHDAELMRVPFEYDGSAVRELLHKLLRRNGAQEATLRVVFLRNQGGMWQGPGSQRQTDLIALTTGLKDWGETVRLAVQRQARHAGSPFAGVKILSWAMNLTWVEAAQAQGFDEVLLLNEHDNVCELTSANIFAAFGNQVLTPPLSSGCLPGVTRQILLEEIRVPGIEVREASLTLADLEKADGLFVTSTTRNLLLVREVQGLRIRTDTHAMKLLSAAFDSYMDRYVAIHKASGVGCGS